MNEMVAVLEVVGLFVLRVGVPLMMLVALGILIDKWQTRRNEEIKRMYQAQEGSEAGKAKKAA